MVVVIPVVHWDGVCKSWTASQYDYPYFYTGWHKIEISRKGPPKGQQGETPKYNFKLEEGRGGDGGTKEGGGNPPACLSWLYVTLKSLGHFLKSQQQDRTIGPMASFSLVHWWEFEMRLGWEHNFSHWIQTSHPELSWELTGRGGLAGGVQTMPP